MSGGIEEISSYGMKDFFRDELVRTTSLTGEGRILGAWDIYSSEYVVSLQPPFQKPFSTNALGKVEKTEYLTLSFDDQINYMMQ